MKHIHFYWNYLLYICIGIWYLTSNRVIAVWSNFIYRNNYNFIVVGLHYIIWFEPNKFLSKRNRRKFIGKLSVIIHLIYCSVTMVTVRNFIFRYRSWQIWTTYYKQIYCCNNIFFMVPVMFVYYNSTGFLFKLAISTYYVLYIIIYSSNGIFYLFLIVSSVTTQQQITIIIIILQYHHQ